MKRKSCRYLLSYLSGGSTRREIGLVGCILDPIFHARGSAIVPFERAMAVSYMLLSCMLSIVTIALSVTIRLQFAIEFLRRSNQHGMGHFGATGKVWGGGVNRCNPNLNKICKRHGAVVCKRNYVDVFCRLSTMQCINMTYRLTDDRLSC